MVAEDNSITVEDANIAAYLRAKGFLVVPFKKEGSTDNKVVWHVQQEGGEGDLNVGDSMNEYYRDTKLQNFISSLKTIRSEMYSIKNIWKMEEGRV